MSPDPYCGKIGDFAILSADSQNTSAICHASVLYGGLQTARREMSLFEDGVW